MNRPSDKLRPVADELAKLISAGSSERERMQALLEQLYANSMPPTPPRKAETGHVGIWKPTVGKDGATTYNRDPALLREWTLWADTAKIAVQSPHKRVVLLGESAARGYLYDPYYNLAKELDGILSKTKLTETVEVTDLAKTNLLLEELVALVPACMALRPDVLVIMAGNNWHFSVEKQLTGDDLARMRALLESGAYDELKACIEDKFRRVATAALQSIAAAAAQYSVPVIFVIPEFNLADWKSDADEQIIPWAPDARMACWLSAREKALAALARGQKGLLESAASLMIASDPTNPLGHELLAQCYLQEENWPAARHCLEQARDTVLFGRALRSKPRCFSVARQTILEEGKRLGMHVVDLVRIFEADANGALPSRDYFLDYCHMSVKGIRVAMTHTAAAVVEVMTGRRPAPHELAPSGIAPAAGVLANAHFCAAIHNAHGGQQDYIMEHHCRAALALSPAIKDAMHQFIDFASRYNSTKFCKSFSDILYSGNGFSQYTRSAGLLHARNNKLLDITLVDIMVNVLADAGMDLSASVNALRVQQHGAGPAQKNLLESFYVSNTYNAFIIEDKLNYLQARRTATEVWVVSNACASISLQLVYRTPGRQYDDKVVRLSCNGEQLAEAPMSSAWACCNFSIPASCLREGVNCLVIEWPYTSEPIAAGKPVLKDYFAACYPVLGEVYTLTAMQPLPVNKTISNDTSTVHLVPGEV